MINVSEICCIAECNRRRQST